MISAARYGFVVFMLLATFIFNKGQAAENPLIGSWKWDNNMTLQNLRVPTQGSDEMKASAVRAKRFVESIKINSLRVTLTYSGKNYIQVMSDDKGKVISRAFAPYHIIQTGKHFLVVDQNKNGGIKKLFFEGNSFFVKVRMGQYTYKDYFTKLASVDKMSQGRSCKLNCETAL